jgi:hypothetical protein
MDASARTLTASLILITTAALIARSFTAAATPPGGTATKTPRAKRKSKPHKNQSNATQARRCHFKWRDEPSFKTHTVLSLLSTALLQKTTSRDMLQDWSMWATPVS